MIERETLQTSLCNTYLLFKKAAAEYGIGPLAAAESNLAEALRCYGLNPEEAAHALLQFDEFSRSYVEAALWATTDESTDAGGDPLDDNYSAADIDVDTLAGMIDDCRRFQEANAADLAQYNHPEWTPAGLGGHDFWLTRNGHGCGFWDRNDCLPEDAAQRLTAAAEKCGEVDLYVGDNGKIYSN
jgi:hypothetical protein